MYINENTPNYTFLETSHQDASIDDGDPMVVVTTNVMHDYVVSRYRFSNGRSHLNLAKFRWTFSRYAHNFCVGLDYEDYESSNRIYVQRRSGWC